ncbi:MAG: sugar transferase [Solirubrobacteraceae bacterium]
MKDRLLIWLRSAAIPAKLGLSLAGGVGVMVAIVSGLGKGLGVLAIGGAAGMVALVAVFYLLGLVMQASQRAYLRKIAFRWQGPAADAHPIEHFNVRPSRGRWPGEELPPHVVRNVTTELEEGLSNEHFVIIKGERPSGKTRLIYEVLRKRANEWVLISNRAPKNTDEEDPLIKLMNDPKGLRRPGEPMVLVLRDCASRLISGSITADFIRSWLLSEPQAAIIVTFKPSDIADIHRGSQDMVEEYQRLEQQARTVSVSSRLTGRELRLAGDAFPELSEENRERLPEYLCSAIPLREEFVNSAVGPNALGNAIVCAVADWRRAGIHRPAPERYIHSVINLYTTPEINGNFDEQLSWACKPVDSMMSLIKKQDGGYLPDPIVLDMQDHHHGRQLPHQVWMAVHREIRKRLDEERGPTVECLIALGIAACERENKRFGKEVLTEAEPLSDKAQRERITRELVPKPPAGSPRELVSTRAGDSVKRRIAETQRLASAPDAPSANTSDRIATRLTSSGLWRQLIPWIYTRRSARTLARFATLVLFDAVSVVIGLTVGLMIRAELDGHHLASVHASVSRFLPLWVAVTVLAFARLGLYRQDAPRGRLSPILLAAGMLGGIGLIAAWTADHQIGALPGAIAGGGLAVALCYRLRVRYDKISRGWVKRNGLEARTLLVGSHEQASAAEQILTGISRPMHIVGYLTTMPDEQPRERCLGTVEDLGTITHEHHIGRVVIADRDMPPNIRLTLANKCHKHKLLVEALPSFADIRAGSADLVVGQSVVLMRLDPLWPANLAFLAKRTFDLIFATLGILVLAIIWVPIAILAKLEGGPVLVSSPRYGQGEHRFLMHRFRTTPPGASPDPNDGTDPPTDMSGLGRFLRSRGLDELPQLLNVLAGDMSIVGPRPLHHRDHAKLQPEQHLRYLVRPGMTGPWLVCKDARGTKLSTTELTALDFAYMHNWTIITDIDILVKTLRLTIGGRSEFPAIT